MQLPTLYRAAVAVGILGLPAACLPDNHLDDQVDAAIDAGTFQNPSANVRPRFRYWIPDASINLTRVQEDVEGAAAAGAGGVEVLGYYLYGGSPGAYVPVDWSEYGWGTPAWKTLFDTLIEVHHKNNLVMDFAMGPNQGQGVPSHPDDDGLEWDLQLATASVPIGGSFNGTLPGWGSGTLQAAITGLVTNAVNTSDVAPSLPNDSPAQRLQKTLATHTLKDVTHEVGADGQLNVDFSSDAPDAGLEHIVFGVYLYRIHEMAQARPDELEGPQTVPTTFVHNGSFIVDHFSAQGAKVITDFWEKYLLVGGTKEALMQVGNYAWEDSIENNPNIYWTRFLPEAFQKARGYSINQWLPILFHQNSLTEHFSTWYITDEADAGNSHIADYRTTLTEGYGEYVAALKDWANDYLDVQWSSQIGYNMAVDMQTDIPIANAPECECLAFAQSIDGYRQFTGPANLAGKRVISTECGANPGEVYQQTLPELLYDWKRSVVGSVNNIIIHGYPYSGEYGNTTWPGFTTFTYAFAEMHGRHQPAWDFYSDPVGYMARLQYIFQSGIPKMDVAFYQKLTTYKTTPRNYLPTDLEEAGYAYSYLNPENLALPEAYVSHGILAPKLQEYKALIVRGNDTMTVLGAERIAQLAHDGLPIIFSGGIPSYLASFNASGTAYVKKTLESIQGLKNVHNVPYDSLADSISSLGIEPITKVKSDSTWFTYWRRNDAKSEDYIYVYNDSPFPTDNITVYSHGTVEFQSTGQPYLYDAWSGEQTPILNYTQTSKSTTIYFELATNEAVVVAFRNSEHAGYHAVSTSSNVLAIANGHSGLEAHVGYGKHSCPGHVTTSDGKRHSVKSTSAKPFELEKWSLTVEHWDPPADLTDINTVAVKHNTTHQLSELVSWQKIDGLQQVSGRGYYETTFDWPPSSDASGAIISFGTIIHTLRVAVNGHTIPALDTTSAVADISKYLVHGSNKIEAIVSTTLANVMTPVWTDLLVCAVPPSGLFGSPTQPSGTTDYGLLDAVVVTPYHTVKLGSK